MPTFAELQSRVASYLIDQPTETVALTPEWINAAIADAMERHNFRAMEATQTYVTAAGVRDLGDKPATWKEARGKPYLIDGQGGGVGKKTKEIEWAANSSEMVRLFNDDSTLDRGEPEFLLEPPGGTSELHVYPYPDELSLWNDGNYRVVVPFWAELAELDDDADTNFFVNNRNLHWYVTYYAVAEGMAFNREEQRAAVYSAKAEIKLRRAIRKDKLSRITSDTIGIYTDANATRFATRTIGLNR